MAQNGLVEPAALPSVFIVFVKMKILEFVGETTKQTIMNSFVNSPFGE